jgi:sphinganine-1-phosphate aldolase
MPQLAIRAEPQATLLAFGAADDSETDIFGVADALWRRGWYVDRQGPPPSLHCTVSVVHEGRIEAFVNDLQASLNEVVQAPQRGAQGSYGTVE